MTPRCVIFDIDGTLVDSTSFDDELFGSAVRDVLGEVTIRPSWGDYEHVTDTGIVTQICRENDLDPGLYVDRIRTHFGALIASHLREAGHCPAVPGAIRLLGELRNLNDVHVGIATGGWGHTARMKLHYAGFDIAGIPLTSSDDAHERVQIMERCRAQLPQPTNTTYIGDAEWDLKASKALGWHFIAVGKRLRGKCSHWVADFSAPLTPDALALR